MSTTVANYLAYEAGNCTRWVAQNASWIPPYLGNAKDWLANGRAQGLATSSTPQVGDVVVYGAGNGYDSQDGHVAIVTKVYADGKFMVSEMNYLGLGVTDNRISTMSGVAGFLVPPTPGQATLTSAVTAPAKTIGSDASAVTQGANTAGLSATGSSTQVSSGSGIFGGILGGVAGFAVGFLLVILAIVVIGFALWFAFSSFEGKAVAAAA